MLSALNTSRHNTIELGRYLDAGLKQWDNAFLLKVVTVLCMSAFITGFDTVVISIINLYLQQDWPDISDWQKEFFISIGSFGGALGALISGLIADRFGRKPLVMASDILYIAGSFMIIFANYVQLMMFGRFLIGFTMGVTSMNLPLYITEICPLAVRGRVVALYTFISVLGQLFANVFSLMLVNRWRDLLGIGIGIGVLQFILMFFISESPRWLASRGKVQEANEVMCATYKKEFQPIYIASLNKEIQVIKSSQALPFCE